MISPPKRATCFLLLFLRKDLAEEVTGDLEEKFYLEQKKKTIFRARLNYWFQVFHYLRGFAIRKTKRHFNYYSMFRHSLLLSFRNFTRYKTSFLINLAGLSTGLACTLLIYLWVHDERSIDKFHAQDANLYQILENSTQTGGIKTQAAAPDLLAETMAKEIPEIEYAVAVTPYREFGTFVLTAGDHNVKAVGQFVGKDFFNVFSYKITQGNARTVIAGKKSIVISESLAIKLFHTLDHAIGRTIDYGIITIKEPVIVSGVFEDTPSNSSEQFDFVLSFEEWKDLSAKIGRPINWDNHAPYAFVVLKDGSDLVQFNRKIKGLIKSKNPTSNVDLFAVPFSDRYLYGTYENGKPAGGRIKYVTLFSVVALFILGIACINFMNLSTARASRRIKEVGVKKAIGAGRLELVFQYLSESMLLTLLSFFTAVMLVAMVMPQFNYFTGKHLQLTFNLPMVLSVVGIILCAGLLAGSYPALYLSGFNAAAILKGSIKGSFGEMIARKGLVVFQFSLSILLIVSVIVVYRQVDYVSHQNLGYDKDNIISFPREGRVAESQDAFLAEAMKIPGVVGASALSGDLMGGNSSTDGVTWEGKNPDSVIPFENITADYGIIETLGVQMVSGRSFSRAHSTDAGKLIFNQAAIDVMGIGNPVGKTVTLWGNQMEILGVVKNFHFESLHEPFKPLFFMIEPKHTLRIMVRFQPGRESDALAGLEKLYADFNPGYSLDYTFLDQKYQLQYASEKRVGVLAGCFAAFAILISCLGLFGLAAFTAERRIKEIGIRKVMGASVMRIVFLLSTEFTQIVIIAVVIALPLSYLIAQQWLAGFAFRIGLEAWYFVSTGFAALLIAWLTVGIQTLKAAKVNPTECLKEQ